MVKDLLNIFVSFAKVGITTFGGGYAVIPIVDRELVKKRNWVTMDEVMDYYTIAQITPGLIIVNLSTFIGYKRKGIPGGIFATLGFVLPGVTIIIAVALLISNFAEFPAVQNAFAGIRIAVGALILDTVVKLVKGLFKDAKALVIYIIVFVISVYPRGLPPLGTLPAFARSPVTLVLLSGLVGLIIYREKKPPIDNTKENGK